MVRSLFVLSLIFMVVPCIQAAGVKIDKVDDHFTVTTDIYTAQVDANGGLTSLVINDVEFMGKPTPIDVWYANAKWTLPTMYACNQNQWHTPYKMPDNVTMRDNVLHAEGNGWTLEYAFLPDAIDLSWVGTPEGKRSFRAGYPTVDLVLSLSKDLDRATDPKNQGELGWPVNRPHEPGDFAILAKNGAGMIVEGATSLNAMVNSPHITSDSHRLDLVVFNTNDQDPKPIHHRLTLFKQADLAHSLTMQIQSPNPDHVFSAVTEVKLPVKVSVLYGKSFHGKLVFNGSPFIWKKPEVHDEVPLDLTAQEPTKTVMLPIHPPKAGHYTGMISVMDGDTALYSQRVGFLYRPEEIPPAQAPVDFDKFWDDTLAELATVPLDMTLEPQPDKETEWGVTYKVKYRSWKGRWAYAWMYVPKKDAKYTAMIHCPPVGVGQPGLARQAADELRIDPAIHGGDIKDANPKTDFNYMNTGITSRDDYMMRYAYCCLVRCYDIIKAQPKCNGQVTLIGPSQGGGLSLVLAGLRSPNRVLASTIALCRIDWTVLGYAQWGPRCPQGEDPEKVAAVVRYYDPASFAHRIHTPLRLGFGLFDWCAPAEGIYTAINALPKDTPCEIFVDPYASHFTYNGTRFGSDAPGLIPPRWVGTDEENHVVK